MTDRPERKRYEITEDGAVVGFVTYLRSGDTVELVHTEIDPAHGGRGLAGVLVRAVLDDARARGSTVLPRCPYVAAFIGDHRDEYLDLVAPEQRERFGLE